MFIREGESVYIRSLSTRRAAVAEVLGLVQRDGHQWVSVRLVTAWYDWDAPQDKPRLVLASGQTLFVDPKHLEAIRR